MAMKLHGAALSPFVARVLLQCRFKGIEIALEPPPEGGLKDPAYLALNPIGKMPILVTDAGVIPESQVICTYLEELYPEPTLLPGSVFERARVRALARMIDLYLFPAFRPIIGQAQRPQKDQAVVGTAVTEIAQAYGYLEHFMAEGPFLAGPKPSLADCTMVPVQFFLDTFMPMVGVTEVLKDHPKLSAWWTAAQNDSTVAALLASMQESLAAFQQAQAAKAAQA